jgi:hypothetical protein
VARCKRVTVASAGGLSSGEAARRCPRRHALRTLWARQDRGLRGSTSDRRTTLGGRRSSVGPIRFGEPNFTGLVVLKCSNAILVLNRCPKLDRLSQSKNVVRSATVVRRAQRPPGRYPGGLSFWITYSTTALRRAVKEAVDRVSTGPAAFLESRTAATRGPRHTSADCNPA